jgi:hypothetical protein
VQRSATIQSERTENRACLGSGAMELLPFALKRNLKSSGVNSGQSAVFEDAMRRVARNYRLKSLPHITKIVKSKVYWFIADRELVATSIGINIGFSCRSYAVDDEAIV